MDRETRRAGEIGGRGTIQSSRKENDDWFAGRCTHRHAIRCSVRPVNAWVPGYIMDVNSLESREPRSPMRQSEPDLTLIAPLSLSGALLAAGLTVIWQRRWAESEAATPRRALFDGMCHIGTALAVALPALPHVEDRWGFIRAVVCGAVAIDLDHIPAARSTRLERCMSMTQRPASHSVFTVIALAVAVELLRPGRQAGLGALLGLSSHLVRDLATGGAPLIRPRSVITIPVVVEVILLCALALAGRRAAFRTPQ